MDGEPIFHIGSYRTKFLRKKVKRSAKKSNPSSISNNEHVYSQLSAEVNPLYIKNQVQYYLDKSKQQILFQPIGQSEIVILIKNTNPDDVFYTIAFNSLIYMRNTYFEWYITLLGMNTNLTNAIYGSSYILILNRIFSENQTVRWAFKRLLAIWLKRVCLKKRIGYDKDLVTQESISIDDRIELLCMKSRCIYCFSGNTLIKSVCSNLETQVNAIPVTCFPKNPYTNIIFNYGQMLHIYNECLKWCSKKSKVFPIAFSMYRQYMFSIRVFTSITRSYLQHNAAIQYINNDDIDSDFFFETLNDFIMNYRTKLILKDMFPIPLKCHIHTFRLWLSKDPNHPLLKQWKSFISDYWFYEQTYIFPRENWISLKSVVSDFHSLFQASKPHLRNVARRNYTRRAGTPS